MLPRTLMDPFYRKSNSEFSKIWSLTFNFRIPYSLSIISFNGTSCLYFLDIQTKDQAIFYAKFSIPSSFPVGSRFFSLLCDQKFNIQHSGCQDFPPFYHSVGTMDKKYEFRRFSDSLSTSEKRKEPQIWSKKNFYLVEIDETEHILDCLKSIHYTANSGSEPSKLQSEVESALDHCQFALKRFHLKGVLRALSHPRVAYEFFRWAKRKNDSAIDKYVLTMIIKIVGSAKMIEEMEWILEDMERNGTRKDLLLWTEVICCYANSNLTERAAQTLLAMVESGIRPDRVVFNTLIHSHFRLGHHEEALSAFRLMRRLRIQGSTPLYTSIITIFQHKRMFVEAEALFKEMKDDPMLLPDFVTFLLMINIYLKWNREDSAIELFQQMQSKGVQTHERICYRILGIFKKKGMKKEYEELFNKLAKQNAEKINPSSLNYEEEACNFVPRHLKIDNSVHDEIVKHLDYPQTVLHKSTYKHLFSSLLRIKKFSELKSMVVSLKQKGILPDLVFYSYLLTACSKPEYEEFLNEMWGIMETMEDPMHSLLPPVLQFDVVDAKGHERMKSSCEAYARALSIQESDKRTFYCNALMTFLCKAKKYDSVALLWNILLQSNCLQPLVNRGSKSMLWDLRRLSLVSSLVCICMEFSKIRHNIFHLHNEPPDEIRIMLRPKLNSECTRDVVCIHTSVHYFLKCLNSPFVSLESNGNVMLASGSQICYWLSNDRVYLGLDLMENVNLT